MQSFYIIYNTFRIKMATLRIIESIFKKNINTKYLLISNQAVFPHNSQLTTHLLENHSSGILLFPLLILFYINNIIQTEILLLLL